MHITHLWNPPLSPSHSTPAQANVTVIIVSKGSRLINTVFYSMVVLELEDNTLIAKCVFKNTVVLKPVKPSIKIAFIGNNVEGALVVDNTIGAKVLIANNVIKAVRVNGNAELVDNQILAVIPPSTKQGKHKDKDTEKLLKEVDKTIKELDKIITNIKNIYEK